MRICVPDASVILKWVVPAENEEYVEQALALRNAFLNGAVLLVVPPLWFFEVGNTLARKYPREATRQLGSLRLLQIQEQPIDDQWQDKALELACNHNVTFYDAAYHASAIVSGGRFVTADEKYLEKVEAAGHLMHLRDWAGD